jgi:hypothetical protein
MTLSSNYYILIEAVRIFEIACGKSPEIIHNNTIHRILGTCCMVAAKFYYDGYNSKGCEQMLGVRRSKLCEMEKVLFYDVLGGFINFNSKAFDFLDV